MSALKVTQPIEACLIDLDGTLVDTLGDFEAALNQMLAALGRAPVTRAQIALMVGKGSEHLIKSALALDQRAPAAIETIVFLRFDLQPDLAATTATRTRALPARSVF